MKKSKLIFSLLIAMIILVAMSVKSSAVTLSTSETPSTVDSGSEFSIVLKFDEKITAVNAHILYDKDLVTMSADNSQGIAIKPEYSEGDLALIYSTFSATDNEFKITAKAAEVTEEKVAEFKVTDLQLATETSAAESLDSQTFKVTIKPATSTGITVNTTDVKLNVGESTTITASGTGSLTWKSSDESIAKVDQNGKITALKAGTATITVTDEAGNTKTIKVTVSSTASSVDSSVTNKGQLAKTGESSVLLLIIGAIAIIAVVTGIKTKKTKLFVMLPLLVAVTIAGKTAEAKTVGVASDKTTTGILSEMPDLNGIKAIGVSANDTFLAYDKNEQNDKLLLSDLTKFFAENSITNPTVTSEDGKTKSNTEKLATGDTIKSGNTEYKLVIFGDADGDGEICKSNDIKIVIHDYLDNAEENNVKKAEGITKVAANIYVEKETENRYRLNVFDINRMKLKYIANENGDPIIGDTLINDESVFTEDKEDDSAPVITPSGNITLDVGETKKLTADKDVTWSSSDSTIATVDENGNIKGIKEGTATITATDKTTGKTATVTVTVGKAILALSKDNGSTWTNYTTLAEAVSAAGTDASVIKVLENTELSFKKPESSDGTMSVLIGEKQDITLDLNGKEITNTEVYSLLVSGQLTIKDSVGNGSITGTNPSQQALIGNYSDGGKIIVESGILAKSTDETSTYQCRAISAGYGYVEVNGGTITSTGGRNIGITGSDIVINGGTITAKHMAVSSDNGDLEINGGTITSTGYHTDNNKNVVVSSSSSTDGHSNIRITGGNITAPSAYDSAVLMNGTSGDISISGGNINGGYAGGAAIYQKVYEGSVYVYGGDISGYSSAITQEQGDDIIVDCSGNNDISIKQSSSGDIYSEKNGAIVKLDEGNITIGTNNDVTTYTEELNIVYHQNGIVAENASVVIYNGYLEKTVGYAPGARSIGSAKSISIAPREGYNVSGTIETDTTTNKQYVVGEIKYTASN